MFVVGLVATAACTQELPVYVGPGDTEVERDGGGAGDPRGDLFGDVEVADAVGDILVDPGLDSPADVSMDLVEVDSSEDVSMDLVEVDSSGDVSMDLVEVDLSGDVSMDLVDVDSPGDVSADLVDDAMADTPVDGFEVGPDSPDAPECLTDLDCDDGLFCNGAEVCDAVDGCLAGIAPRLEDALNCTVGSCDEVNDRVVQTPDDAACSNGLYCDGAEICDPVLGCVAGPPPSLQDGVGCTDDLCDEIQDVVNHVPMNQRCDNSLFCDGTETCDVVADCQPGVAPVLSDGITCTVDSCDEELDVVVHEPTDALCPPVDSCAGGVSCQVDVGCVSGAAADDGTVCGEVPRAICLSSVCGASVCGDGYVDSVTGEQCDDGGMEIGDGCDASCLVEPGYYSYPGIYTVDPAVDFSCYFNSVGFHLSAFAFDEVASRLEVDTQDEIGANPDLMVQTPNPNDGSFAVSEFTPGGCDERYELVGAFDTTDTWAGTFSWTYTGTCGDCISGSAEITGTRQ